MSDESSAEARSASLDRRQLLGIAGAAAAGFAVSGQKAGAQSARGSNVATSATAAVSGDVPFELAELSVRDLQAGQASGRWTARRLTELYLERIAAVDRRAGATNSVAETNPDALAIADALDAERRAGKLRGPLHGIPVVLKDNIDTGDRMKTTAGSLALAHSSAAKDAAVAERLRAAGAVLLGKTNLSEWANFRSTRSTSGWSGRGGQVRNPYALDRNPCGSSSGTGSGISANMAAVGVGTETDGSIICPASMCGLVGIKPTVGRVSRRGIIPISASQDTAGPMARTVADAAILLAALSGADPLDAVTGKSSGDPADFEKALDGASLRGARLGVARNFFGWHPEIDRQMEEVIAFLKGAGAEVIDTEVANTREYDATEYQVLLYEFKDGLNAYLAGLPRTPENEHARSLATLIAWNEKHAARSMPWFGQEIFLAAEAKGPLTEAEYVDALAKNHKFSRAEGLDAALGAHRLDALVCPSMGPAYPIDWVCGDHYSGSCTSPSAVSGYPHVTVPAGFVHGLPWGLSLLGPAWSEAKLIRYAAAFERERGARQPPKLPATVDFSV